MIGDGPSRFAGRWTRSAPRKNAPGQKDSGRLHWVLQGCRRRPTLPRSRERSTIGAVGLNDRVRNGNECGPYALVASEISCMTSMFDFGRVVDRGISNSLISYCSACSVAWYSLWGSSQAARAIRTAALGIHCWTSTGGLSTEWSAPALQEAQGLGRVHLGACFPLRCFQRLSQPTIATRRCSWRNNRDTSGSSDSVLSY